MPSQAHIPGRCPVEVLCRSHKRRTTILSLRVVCGRGSRVLLGTRMESRAWQNRPLMRCDMRIAVTAPIDPVPTSCGTENARTKRPFTAPVWAFTGTFGVPFPAAGTEST